MARSYLFGDVPIVEGDDTVEQPEEVHEPHMDGADEEEEEEDGEEEEEEEEDDDDEDELDENLVQVGLLI